MRLSIPQFGISTGLGQRARDRPSFERNRPDQEEELFISIDHPVPLLDPKS